ncbi:MAG: hypothetical protein RIC55_35795 [Pirellulaceae bacterium]
MKIATKALFAFPPAVHCLAVMMFVVAGSLGSSACAEEESPAEQLKLKTEKVIVFKDGYCLIVKRGTATTNDQGEVYNDEVPDSAVLGSFWATPTEGRLIGMTAGWREVKEEVEKEFPCTSTLEVLEANLGKACSLQLADKGFVSGQIARVLTKPSLTPVSPPQIAQLGMLHTALRADIPGEQAPTLQIAGAVGNQFVLSTDEGDVLIDAGEVKRLTVEDMKTTITRKVTSERRTKRLSFRFEEGGQRRELVLMYFRPGVRWIPTYRINLTTNDKKEKIAKIAMQAEILNEAEDLIDTPLDIVVGVPNFRFRETVSPLVLEATMRNTLIQAAPNLMGQGRNDFSNALYTQRSVEFRRDAAQANGVGGGGTVALPDELTATGAQDLFVYNLPKMSLKQGERTAMPIVTSEVPYRDVYTWDLHVTRQDIAAAPSGSGVSSPLVLSQNKVWRQIELTNNTKLPWTTGAAMIMADQQPLAQELLTYTSPKDACRVPVTVSVDTRGSFQEEETDRELQALTWDGYRYARIEQQAKLDLCNNKPETIEAEITFRFGGKATKVSDDGKVTLTPYRAEDWQNYRGQPAVNNSSLVTWKVKLEPGDTFQPTVDYHFFTRQ